MLTQMFQVTVYALALAALSALVLWAIPRAYFATTPVLQRMLTQLDRWLQRHDKPPRPPRGGRRAPVWPRLSGPA